MLPIFVYIQHRAGAIDDTAAELAAAARKIDPAQSPTAVVTGCGADLDEVCETLRTSFAEVWKIAGEALAYPNAELVRQALAEAVPEGGILLVPHNHFGVDLSPGLSIKMNAAYASDVVGIDGLDGSTLRMVRQEFGGQVSTHVRCDVSTGAVINVRPGAFQPLETPPVAGVIREIAAPVFTARRRYVTAVAAEAGEIDITKYKVLVSVGRGIQEKDNIGIAEELAEALGGAVSCSRPVVDAKWLEKSRQVGSSGKTVKPKVYLACGISGSFQHLAGIKGPAFLVAINKNPKAPIFRVADIGIVEDILEFLPELTARVRAERAVSTK
jgi:electron transfer flavoprotein alpha subunit